VPTKELSELLVWQLR